MRALCSRARGGGGGVGDTRRVHVAKEAVEVGLAEAIWGKVLELGPFYARAPRAVDHPPLREPQAVDQLVVLRTGRAAPAAASGEGSHRGARPRVRARGLRRHMCCESDQEAAKYACGMNSSAWERADLEDQPSVVDGDWGSVVVDLDDALLDEDGPKPLRARRVKRAKQDGGATQRFCTAAVSGDGNTMGGVPSKHLPVGQHASVSIKTDK